MNPDGPSIRIHGDYHLGQTLRTEKTAPNTSNGEGRGDFVLLDFEGEPSKSLAERRRKQSPLRDVAGMLRSFSYAAFAGLNQYKDAHPEAAAEKGHRLEQWARAWEESAAGAFLRAYRDTVSAKPGLLPPVAEAQKLLNAYVLEKALYELLYELNNRPTWLRIPIAGILTL